MCLLTDSIKPSLKQFQFFSFWMLCRDSVFSILLIKMFYKVKHYCQGQYFHITNSHYFEECPSTDLSLLQVGLYFINIGMCFLIFFVFFPFGSVLWFFLSISIKVLLIYHIFKRLGMQLYVYEGCSNINATGSIFRSSIIII
jgi:hypothetical protein